MISNPDYKGKWAPRKIPNPDYFEDATPYKMTPFNAVGFELWTLSNDIYFDNIVITENEAEAQKVNEMVMLKKIMIRHLIVDKRIFSLQTKK